MKEIIVVIDVLVAIALIGLVLLQQGKGADMGAAFGSGASQTLFGSRGTANFLTRATAVLATVFFAANLALAYFATHAPAPETVTGGSIMQEPASQAPTPTPPETPQAPTVPEVPR